MCQTNGENEILVLGVIILDALIDPLEELFIGYALYAAFPRDFDGNFDFILD